jgi:FkbM family methyltransferase
MSSPGSSAAPQSVLGTGRASAVLRPPIARLRARLAPALARRRDTLAVRLLAAAAQMLLEMVANVNFEIADNGELAVIRQLAAVRPGCIFDVGANVGNWSLTVSELCPEATIHAFEIVPPTARTLAQRVAPSGPGRIVVNPVGLSDVPGTVTVEYPPHASELASAAAATRAGEVTSIECPVSTGDIYCRERGIEHIDLLKIDVEGLEGRVLAGFSQILSAGGVDVVQFEYGRRNAEIPLLLGELYAVLEAHGFAVGKIYPDGVEFRGYDAWRDEDFLGPNYLAVRRARADLIEALAA